MNNRHRVRLLCLLVAVLLIWTGVIVAGKIFLFQKDDSRRVKIVLRFDDYSSVSDTAVESSLIGLLRKHNVPCTFAVIPAVTGGDYHNPAPIDSIPLTATKAAILRTGIESGLIEVAQHGLTHQTVAERSQKTISEFAGVPLDSQRRRIIEGKRILEQQLGRKIEVFVPPWEHYDESTLVAVADAGFKIFSAAKKGVTLSTDRLTYLPSSFALAGLQKAVNEASRIPDTTSIIVAVVHAYDFVDSLPNNGQMTMGRLDSTMGLLCQSERIRYLTMSQAATVLSNLDGARVRAYARYIKSSVHQLLPNPLESLFPIRVYVGADYATRLFIWGWVWIILTGLSVLAVTLISALIIISFIPPVSRAVRFTVNSLVSCLLITVLWVIADHGAIYSFGLVASLVLLGLTIGSFLGLRVVFVTAKERPR